MNTRISLPLGVAIGALAATFTLRASSTWAELVLPPRRAVAAPTAPTSHGKSLAVMRGEMAIVRSKDVVAVIELTGYATRAAKYRWRARRLPGGLEEHGEGALYERFETQPRADGTTWMDNANSVIKIAAGPVSLNWSYRSVNSGWLYFKDTLDVSITDASSFEKLSLYQLASR